MIMEDIIEMMRTRDIGFNARGARADSGSFEISYQSDSARTAQQVALRLASLFIQENMQDRAVLAEQTDEFLGSQLLEVERQLKEREKQLEDFRRSHPGAMPAQVESNQTALQNAQLQLTGGAGSITAIATARSGSASTAGSADGRDHGAAAREQPSRRRRRPMLASSRTARETMKNLRMKLTPDHPDIRALNRTIKELEQKAAAEASQAPVSGAAAAQRRPKSAARPGSPSFSSRKPALQRRVAQRQEDERQLLATMSASRGAPRVGAERRVAADRTDAGYTTLQRRSITGCSARARTPRSPPISSAGRSARHSR